MRSPFVDEVEKDGKMVEEPKKAGFLGATGLLAMSAVERILSISLGWFKRNS